MPERRKTRQITLGDAAHGIVRIGGDAPIAVQTMTSTYTHDVTACVAEIQRMAASSPQTLPGTARAPA